MIEARAVPFLGGPAVVVGSEKIARRRTESILRRRRMALNILQAASWNCWTGALASQCIVTAGDGHSLGITALLRGIGLLNKDRK